MISNTFEVPLPPAVHAVFHAPGAASLATLAFLLFLFLRLFRFRTFELMPSQLLLNEGLESDPRIHPLTAEASSGPEALPIRQSGEDRFHMLVASIDDIVFTADCGGIITGIFGKGVARAAISPTEFIGRHFGALGGEQAGLLGEKYRYAADEQVAYTWWRDGENGCRHYYHTTVSPLVGAAGSVDGYVGIAREISDYRTADEALRKLQGQNELILKSAGEGIFGIDRQGIVTFVNPAAARFLRTVPEALAGKPVDVAVPHFRWDGTHCSADVCLIQDCIRRGAEGYFPDMALIRSDGSTILVEVTVSPMSEQGTVVGAVVMFKDISFRKKAEAELRKLHAAVEQSPVLVMITDASGNLEYVNPRFCQVTGYLREEVLGRNPRFMKSGYTSDEEYRQLWDTITGGGEWRGEFRNRKKTGDIYVETATIAPVRDAVGTITHFVAVKEDVTELRHMEDQLRHAQKMEAVGRLAGGVAHDFNNVLTAVIGYATLLQMKLEDDPVMVGYLNQILAAADRATRLTQSLMAFSRRGINNAKPLKLNEIIRNVEPLLTRLLGEDIELRLDFSAEKWTIMGDAGQIEQILMNLATNARDAMPSGGKIVISTRLAYVDGDHSALDTVVRSGVFVLLSFRDTGIGIDPAICEKIFEPFFTTKGSAEGTGLGLSIVYGIVRQHNGFVKVLSQPGEGAEFQIYFPMTEAEAEGVHFAEPVTLKGGAEKILVAEDEREVRDLTRDVLEKFGYSVINASDGEDALQKFADHQNTIDLLVLDLMMPRKKGLDVYREARRLKPQVKCIFTSGYPADVLREKGIATLDVPVLPKPVSPSDLLRRVREVLDT